MKKVLFSLLFAVVSCGAALAAEPVVGKTTLVGVSEQGDAATKRPHNGQSQQEVITLFGKPVKRYKTVGKPPITRWEYARFDVYFESNRVIHAVLRQHS